jgi:hypothetical protein
MKIITKQMHAVLDYATVTAFLVAPTLFGLTGLAALLSYALAAIHFAMTAFTNMPGGLVKLIPLKLHAIVEMLVGPVLIVLALALPQFSAAERYFFIAAGVAIVAVWVLSEYDRASAAS